MGIRGAAGGAARFASARSMAKMGSRAVPITGWAMIILDFVMLGHELGRRIVDGKSDRLVKAEDAHAMWGEQQYEFMNNMQVRGFFEQDSDLLKSIGSEGKMNSSAELFRDTLLQENLKKIQGADMINRDPYFDSPDSLLDKVFAKWKDEDIPDLAQQTIDKMRALGYGNTKSGR
jgi:hypothetical protein